MLFKPITISIFAVLAGLGKGAPTARHNDAEAGKPITWVSPDHQVFCWQVDKKHEFKSGQKLFITECNNSPAQQFIYVRGATTIQLAGTDLCVDFPSQGKNGERLRVETCRAKGAPGQKLFITDDDHIALEKGPGQCADVRDGQVKDDLGILQSWRCSKDNINQIFFGKVPQATQNTIRPFVDSTRCLTAFRVDFLPDASPLPIVSIEECIPSSPADQTFLFPTANTTVQHLFNVSGSLEILTWTQELEPFIPPDLYDSRFTNNPMEGFVIFTDPGKGKFDGTVRFRNPDTDFCVTATVLDMVAVFQVMSPCDLQDETQYFYVRPIGHPQG